MPLISSDGSDLLQVRATEAQAAAGLEIPAYPVAGGPPKAISSADLAGSFTEAATADLSALGTLFGNDGSSNLQFTPAQVAAGVVASMDNTTRDEMITFIDEADPWLKITDMPFKVFRSSGGNDTVALQAFLDSLLPGDVAAIKGSVSTSATLYFSVPNVTLDFSNSEIVCSGSGFALIVHGCPIDRTLTGLAWSVQLLEASYDTVTPLNSVKIRGLKTRSNDGARRGAQVMMIFVNDSEISASVSDSNGNGVEIRHCVGVRSRFIGVSDFANYGLFIYQSHDVRINNVSLSNGGRGIDIKQRHKNHLSTAIRIDSVSCFDLAGTEDGAWAVIGHAYKDMVREGLSAAAQTERNFAGHERCHGVSIGSFTGSISTGATGVSAPSFHIGTFADECSVESITLRVNGVAATGLDLVGIGNRGDTADGITDGAAFGGNHRIGSISVDGLRNTDASSIIKYGVSASVGRLRITDSVAARIAAQALPAVIPGGSVRQFELRNLVGSLNVLMGPLSERGVLIETQTKTFVSGGWDIEFIPTNLNAETICNPVYIKASDWRAVGSDKVSVPLNAGSNHASTYAVMTTSSTGDVALDVTAAAPTNCYGVYFAGSDNKALVLRPSSFTLSGTPSGTKVGIYLTREITMLGAHAFTGAWGSTVSDTTGGKNSQALRRRIFVSAVPSSGSWTSGDEAINIVRSITANSNILLSWSRVTTGSNNVLGTDWIPVYGRSSDTV